MNRAQAEALWQQALDLQLLPADARPPDEGSRQRPWPVVLLTALGAWFAAVPLVAVMALMFGSMFEQGGAYLAGVLLLAASAVVLRSVSVPLFLEQLAVPLLLTGGACLGFGLFKDLPDAFAAAVLAGLALVLAFVVRASWLKACLGGLAAGFTAMVFWPLLWDGRHSSGAHGYGLGWQVCTGAWLLACLWERRVGLPTAMVAVLSGWSAMTLLGLALSSGRAMLVGAPLRGGVADAAVGAHLGALGALGGPGAVSVVLALLAAAWLGRAWPALCRPGYLGVAGVLAGLAAFIPALGAVLLMGAGCAAQARWRLVAAATLAAVWVISSFYYQLAWPLATKAGVLAAAGAVLGLLVWTLWHRPAVAAPVPGARDRGLRAGAALTLVAVLGVINVAIWQKETLIAEGQPVFVPLAPADPRSLMQGDFMRLNFALPRDLPMRPGGLEGAERLRVVATLDERRIAQALRLHDGGPLAPGELLIELTPKAGRWMLVTDAWFFKEGEAGRWSAARFGEFRVKPDGQALLVDLRAEGLGKL